MTAFFTWDFWCFRHFRRIPIEYLVPDKILQKRMLYSDLGATIREQNNRQRVNDAWAHARLRRPRFVKRGTIADGRVLCQERYDCGRARAHSDPFAPILSV